jgi:hypothetical protein
MGALVSTVARRATLVAFCATVHALHSLLLRNDAPLPNEKTGAAQNRAAPVSELIVRL